MKYLFNYWKDFCKRLRKAEVIFLFFDYDGTLTPIVKKPELAVLSHKMKCLLKKLTSQKWTKVTVVSGRSLKDVKNVVGLNRIAYAGNHGLELEGLKLKYTNKKALKIKRDLDAIYNRLVENLSIYSKLLIEHKGLTLSVHYRLEKNKKRLNRIFKILKNTTDIYVKQKKIRLAYGKKVVEIRPRINWNKGKIVLWLLEYFKQKTPLRNTLSIYLGDDTTDEDAFNILRKRGVGIFVGSPKRKSLAKFYLRNTEEVANFLEKIINYRQP